MARVKLGEVAREYKATVKDSTGLPSVGLEHLISGEIALENWDEEKENTFTKGFKKGHMLFGRRRAYLKKAALAPFDGVCSGDIIVIEAISAKLNPDLLPFIIQNDLLFDYAMGNSAGSLSPRVKWESLKNYEFELPDLDKQDELVKILQAAYETKRAYYALLYTTDELIKSQFVEMFGNDTIDKCQWPVERMEDVFSITSSRRILKSEWKSEGTIPFIRVRDMVHLANGEPLTNEFYVSDDFYNSRPEEEKTQAGDIIVSATSTVGKTYVIKEGERFYFKDADVLLFRKKKSINGIFFTYGLTMPTMWQQIEPGLGATTVAHFLISKACRLLQPMPPIELQEKFAALIEQTDKSKLELKKAIKDIEDLMKSIM